MRKLSNFFKTLLSFFFLFLISNIAFSQQDTLVKRQYVDSNNASTTVVVKNKSANDLDILTKQFHNVGFGDVIFIKTENLSPSKPKSERTSFEDIIKETSTPAPKVTSTPTPVIKKTITKSKSKPIQKVQQPKLVANKTIKKESTPEAKLPQKYFGVGGARKLKMKKKKLKKRKRVKRSRRNRCYQF